MIEEQENHLEAAKKCYIEAAELTREVDPEPHHALGCLLLKTKKMREAEDEFMLALEIAPGHCRSNYQLGILFLGKGLIERAETRFKNAARDCPDFPLPLVELARLFMKQKRYEEALAFLEKAFALDTTAPEPFMGRAEAKKALGERTEACGSYLEAAARFTARSQYEDAVRACREALSVAPRDPKTPAESQLLIQSHNDLGVALMNTGAFTEALDELKKSADLEPENLLHRFNMGLCYAKKGDKARAAETYRDILKKKPPIAYRVMELLADLYVSGARDNPITLDEAVELLKQALPQEGDDERKALVRRRIEELGKERNKNR
jgi:tetratricopeptide (TPR) repeat protein